MHAFARFALPINYMRCVAVIFTGHNIVSLYESQSKVTKLHSDVKTFTNRAKRKHEEYQAQLQQAQEDEERKRQKLEREGKRKLAMCLRGT